MKTKKLSDIFQTNYISKYIFFRLYSIKIEIVRCIDAYKIPVKATLNMQAIFTVNVMSTFIMDVLLLYNINIFFIKYAGYLEKSCTKLKN